MAGKSKNHGKSLPSMPDEDAALWQRITDTVKPLARNKSSNRAVENPVKPTASIERADPSLGQPRTYRHGAPPPRPQREPVNSARDLDHGSAPGLDKRTHQRMIKGKMPIDGRLDLHGHTKESAHRALDSFIKGAFSAGRRCVIIITGKGLRVNSGEVGVLRQSVPQWLNSPELRPMVLAFSHATPKDGGEGALYVLLKRKR